MVLTTLTKAAVYCRVSTEEQAREGFSIDAQKKNLVSFAEIKGWNVIKIYIDEGISGRSTRRPAFQHMLNDAANGLFQVILVWKINRFTRKNSDLLNTVEYLNKYNINLVSFSEQFDASTPSGKLMLSMLGSIGEFERDTIIENIKSGMTERAHQGNFNGGRVLGYDSVNRKLIINQIEASTIKRIYALYLSGNGYKCICDILNSEGRTTKNNHHFQINSVKRILKNPLYAGYITYNRTQKNGSKVIKHQDFINVKGSHEPLVSREDYETVQKIINSKRQTYNNSNSFILSALLRCPKCGGKMTGHTGSKKSDGTFYRYYICLKYKSTGPSACSTNCINADNIENIVIDYLCTLILRPGFIKDIFIKVNKMHHLKNCPSQNELVIIESELANKRMILNRYLKLFEGSTVDSYHIENRIKSINKEITVLTKRLDVLKDMPKTDVMISIDKISFMLMDFRKIFMNLDNGTKKALLLSIVKDIHFSHDKNMKGIVLQFPFLS